MADIIRDVVGRDKIVIIGEVEGAEAVQEIINAKLAAKLLEAQREAEQDAAEAAAEEAGDVKRPRVSGGVTFNVGGSVNIGGNVYEKDGRVKSHGNSD